MERRGDWMQTFTGRQYWPLDPRPEDVCIEDIAHHLSIINRFCGATRVPWSVAEHSVGVLFAFDAMQHHRPAVRSNGARLAVLLHDAPEAYCNDVVRPVKRHLTGYSHIENLNADAIFAALNVPYLLEPFETILKQADNAMLLAEQAAFMGPPPSPWVPMDVPPVMQDAANAYVARHGGHPLNHLQAEAAFLRAYGEVTV